MHGTVQADDRPLMETLQQQVDVFLRHSLTSASDRRLNPKWSVAGSRGLTELVAADGRLRADNLRNFRRRELLAPDLPAAPLGDVRLRNVIVGWRRATVNCLVQCLDILVAKGYDHLLHKYPCHPAGNPYVFRHCGYAYTFGWARHIYALGLVNEILGSRLESDSIALEIGASYGIFPSLLKQEYPGWHNVLVDLPEQLIMAHYFLGSCFPGASIAGVRELIDLPIITREFIQGYDFVLLPNWMFGRLAAGAIDLVASAGSLGEMSQRYFDAYVGSDVYRSARYHFMINRIAARPASYHNDITVLDYPIWHQGKKLHFDVCPIYSVDFLFTSGLFSYTRAAPDPHFEYIGAVL